MTLWDRIALPWALRRLNRHLAEQNRYLKRLADHWAPETDRVPVDPRTRSVDFSEDRQQALILEYVAKTSADVGRDPTDEEILAMLDGKGPGGVQ
jgi:hypothetical protein